MDTQEQQDIALKEQLATDSGFGTYKVADFMKMSFKPKEALIEGLLNIGESVFVCGTPKAGKSIFLQSLAYALSGGEEHFLGSLPITRTCKVCYIQLEGELADTHDRFRRISAGVKHNLDNLMLYFSEPMQLDSLEYTLQVISNIEKVMMPNVIIIDPLYVAFRGSLSDDDVVRKVLSNIRIMKMFFNCTMIIAHHTHKQKRNDKGEVISEGDEAMFGSQFLKAWPDHVLMLNYDQRNGTRTLTCMTQRSATVEKEIKLRLNQPDPLFFEEFDEFPKGIVMDMSKKRILDFIMTYNYPVHAKEIYTKLEMPRSTCLSVLKTLQKEGLIFKSVEGKEVLYFNQKIDKNTTFTV